MIWRARAGVPIAAYHTSAMTAYPASCGCSWSDMYAVLQAAFAVNAPYMSTSATCLPAAARALTTVATPAL